MPEAILPARLPRSGRQTWRRSGMAGSGTAIDVTINHATTCCTKWAPRTDTRRITRVAFEYDHVFVSGDLFNIGTPHKAQLIPYTYPGPAAPCAIQRARARTHQRT